MVDNHPNLSKWVVNCQLPTAYCQLWFHGIVNELQSFL